MQQQAPKFDYLFKLVIVGDDGVGKTSLLSRFVENVISPSYIPTIGVDFKIKTIESDGKHIKLQMWDTAGQERFRTITTAYYRGAHGIIVVFDMTDEKSFKNVRDVWCPQVEKMASVGAIKALVGNKCDLASDVKLSNAKELASSMGVPFIETSALSGSNVTKMFAMVAEDIRNKNAPDNIHQNIAKLNAISNITIDSSREHSGEYDSPTKIPISEETDFSTHMESERVSVGAISTTSSKSFDATLKLAIIGDAQVGKSSILLRLMDDLFSEEYISTIGIEFRAKLVDYNDKTVRCIWADTAGQERFRTSYYRGSRGLIVVYDVTNQKSFDNARDDWLPKLDVGMKKILVGCKSDSSDRVVDETTAQKLAESFGMPFFEVSAKTGSNINKMTDTLVDIVMEEMNFGTAGCVVDD